MYLKRTLTLLMASILLMVTNATPAVAAPETPNHGDSAITPYYSKILTLSASLSIRNRGLAISGTITAQPQKADSVYVEVVVQKLTNSGWKDVITYGKSGTSTAVVIADYKGESNTVYQVMVTGTATKNGVSETDTIYSEAKLCE